MEKNYTPEETQILETIYGYSDKANYSEEDIAMARKMFDTPEKFWLLRRILQAVTPNERGLTIPDSQALVDAEIKDLHKYAIETAVNQLADEKIRQTLLAFYRLIKSKVVEEAKAQIDEKKQAEFEEEKRTEEFVENETQEKKQFGDNL